MQEPTIDWSEEERQDQEMINTFSQLAKIRMTRNRDKGRHGWWDKEICSPEHLSRLLVDHIGKGDPMDIAILAMMLVTRGEKIAL